MKFLVSFHQRKGQCACKNRADERIPSPGFVNREDWEIFLRREKEREESHVTFLRLARR